MVDYYILFNKMKMGLYMKYALLYNLKDSILNQDKIYAHTHKVKSKETLVEHAYLTYSYFLKIFNSKDIDIIAENIISKFSQVISRIDDDIKHISKEALNLIKEMFVNAIYLHDIGKINPLFQKENMTNDDLKYDGTEKGMNTNHSLLSSVIYIDIYYKKINRIIDEYECIFLIEILKNFAYVISRHHTYLRGMNDFIQKIEDLKEDIINNERYLKYLITNNIKRININHIKNNSRAIRGLQYDYISMFILTKLLYSLIVACDSYATHQYMTDNEIEFGDINNIEEVINTYQNTKVYKGIQEYQKNKDFFKAEPINALRSELFLEVEKNLIANLDKSIFYLEAPTGSGKTNTSINLALNIIKEKKEYKKIFYIFPFNTLVEQTKQTFDVIFSDDFKPVVINSVVPPVTDEEYSVEKSNEMAINYDKSLLNRQFLHYPVILTTHINFFNYLFGTGRAINFPLIHLFNSVVIIDEIQSYKNELWMEIIMFLHKYAKLLNMKIIIMSATLPKLDGLLNYDCDDFVELIKEKNKYYQNKLFKDRVKINFELLNQESIELEDIVEKINEVIHERKPQNTKVLIEFMTKTTAREFFNLFKNDYQSENVKTFELTGDDNNAVRKEIIREVKKENIDQDMILVATQTIEAGVDIDMDIGFKDISMLDSEEQFLGRINRSCKKENSVAYFFSYDSKKLRRIYRNDLRLEKTLENEQIQKYLLNKDFQDFYEHCFKNIKYMRDESNKNNIENFQNEVRYLDFDKICKRMQLIDSQNVYQVYLSYQLEFIDEEGDKIQLDGKEIWNKYKTLLDDKDMEYAEKKIKLYKTYSKMQYFLYNIRVYGKQEKNPPIYNDCSGSIYYIEDGEEYMTDNKFDREKFNNANGLFI